jgi:hypothetical protein
MISKKKLTENFGKALFDIGKLIFASIVLGTIIKGDVNRVYLLLFGSIIALLCIYVGILFLSKKED